MFDERTPIPENPTKKYYQLPSEFSRPQANETPEVYEKRLAAQFGPEMAYLLDAEAYLDKSKIKLNYQTNLQNRASLHSRPGIALANHPSDIDVSIVLRALQDEERRVRKDFLVLIAEGEFGYMTSLFGKEHFLPASREHAVEIFEKIRQFIQNGGLFIIFPSFKLERSRRHTSPLPSLAFENGLAYLLPRVPAESMVYTFGINRDQMVQARSLILQGGEVEVTEGCNSASDWQKVLEAVPTGNRFEQSKLLARHFASLHPETIGSQYNIE